MSIGEAKRIAVTSYSGQARETSTEWVVSISDTRIGFWTPDASGWAARTASSAVVSLQECDGRGKVDRTQPVFEGRAEVVTEGAVFDEIKASTHEKYRVGAFVSGVVDRVKELGGHATPEGAVVINIVG